VDNFLRLRDQLGELVVPVLQGWENDDYLRHVEMYEASGVDLHAERLVGVGSVCRRSDARYVMRALDGLPVHGFGIKGDSLVALSDMLASADSMAWSYSARYDQPLPGHTHKSCANCMDYALLWRSRLMRRLGQLRLWEGTFAC
jgi:hypothetical protein